MEKQDVWHITKFLQLELLGDIPIGLKQHIGNHYPSRQKKSKPMCISIDRAEDMTIDIENLTAFASSSKFDWKDPQDPLKQQAEESFGEIIKPIFTIDGMTIYLCKGKEPTLFGAVE